MGLPGRTIAVMAVACGVGVANAYFPQAIVPLLVSDLHVSESAAAAVATTVQFGYAGGIFLLVPLGDRLPRRWLIGIMFGVVAIGLLRRRRARLILGLGLTGGRARYIRALDRAARE